MCIRMLQVFQRLKSVNETQAFMNAKNMNGRENSGWIVVKNHNEAHFEFWIKSKAFFKYTSDRIKSTERVINQAQANFFSGWR